MGNAWEKQGPAPEQVGMDPSKMYQFHEGMTNQFWNQYLTPAMDFGQGLMNQYGPQNLMNFMAQNTPMARNMAQDMYAPMVSGYQDLLGEIGRQGLRQGTQQFSGMNALFSPAAQKSIIEQAYARPSMEAMLQLEQLRGGAGMNLLGMGAQQFGMMPQLGANLMQAGLGVGGSFAAPSYQTPYTYTPQMQPGWAKDLTGMLIGAGGTALGGLLGGL